MRGCWRRRTAAGILFAGMDRHDGGTIIDLLVGNMVMIGVEESMVEL